MANDAKEGVFRKAMKGICSMTLLVFLYMVVFYLFPRMMILVTVLLSLPFIWRRFPKTKQV